MKRLKDLIQLSSGSPQFRIAESTLATAPQYYFYGQQEMENDLVEIEMNKEAPKTIRTFDEVNTLKEGDVLFSLISGKTTIVKGVHQGYLYTQNYVKLELGDKIDSRYIVYLLNESEYIKKQWLMGLQGSAVLKHTVSQLRELELPKLHTIKKQRIIGSVYFDQLRLQALKTRAAETEKMLTIKKLKGVT